jgi:alanine dehydrogenase
MDTLTPQKCIGFPRMEMEAGEKRAFLPDFIQRMADFGLHIVIEEGYGSPLGFDQTDYRKGNPKISFSSRQDTFNQDVVLILRSPDADFERMKPGTVLMSMLHYPTRPNRITQFQKLGLRTISLDSIANDQGVRLVENMKAVAWNGLEVAFGLLEDYWGELMRPDEKPIQTLLLGTGMVGKHAVDAVAHLGNIKRNNKVIKKGFPGAVCKAVGRNLTNHPEAMIALLQGTDILIDATQRHNPAQPVIPNPWIQYLPEHAILLDLSVDPYIPQAQPAVVRGIEGIPKGDLDKFVFFPSDPDWEETIAPGVPSQHRRTVVSCYSWPGFHPKTCMRHYAQQISPIMPVLINKGYDGLSPTGAYFERALYRGTFQAWEDQRAVKVLCNSDKPTKKSTPNINPEPRPSL